MIFPRPVRTLENDHGEVDLEEVSVWSSLNLPTPGRCADHKPHPADFSVTLKLKSSAERPITRSASVSTGSIRTTFGRCTSARSPRGEDPVHACGQRKGPPTPQRARRRETPEEPGLRVATRVRGQWLNAWVDGKRNSFFVFHPVEPAPCQSGPMTRQPNSIRSVPGALNPKFVLAKTPTLPKRPLWIFSRHGSTRTHRRNATGRTSRPGHPFRHVSPPTRFACPGLPQTNPRHCH
ncbi:MAG: hypothetical protein CM1200mP2_49580 [Planctomycetaceae bacterium]|nr:MAG: hypothetical protein CM1200mP2_49580 [Planctomycetaceae bacterium]